MLSVTEQIHTLYLKHTQCIFRGTLRGTKEVNLWKTANGWTPLSFTWLVIHFCMAFSEIYAFVCTFYASSCCFIDITWLEKGPTKFTEVRISKDGCASIYALFQKIENRSWLAKNGTGNTRGQYQQVWGNPKVSRITRIIPISKLIVKTQKNKNLGMACRSLSSWLTP